MMSAVLLLSAKATAVIALAIAAGWLARRRRAAVRHAIFAGAFAALALLPAAAALMPEVSVRLPVRRATVDTTRAIPISQTVRAGTLEAGRPSEPRAASRTWLMPSSSTLLSIAWLSGTVGCFVPVLLGLWQIGRVRRDGLPWRDAQIMTDDLARDAGFSRRIDVMVHEAVAGPITCGVVRPAIVFPPDARTWSDGDVRRALTHELEHLRRCDWVTLCLARVVCALYWFHPLVWIANRQLGVNAERACDDAVLLGGHALGYADQLVKLAERSLAQTRRPLLAMASRGDLSTRVHAVLSTQQPRGPAGPWTRVTVMGVAVASVALLAPLRTAVSALGQTPASGARSQFVAASIKPSPLFDRIMNVRLSPGRLTADATVQVLMQYAYGVQPFQLTGGPGWLKSDHYEIQATADGSASRDRILLMLQSLLEDRFQLKAHREMKELPVFTLVSNRGGLKLPAPKEGGCVDSPADAALEWTGGGRMAAPGELAPAKGRCGSAIVGLGQVRGGKIAMSELARALSTLVGRTVIDKTGVTELFDVQLDFVPDDTTPAMPPPPPGSGIAGPSIVQALQEQLGLRLESAKGPVELIVIDQAERPSAN